MGNVRSETFYHYRFSTFNGLIGDHRTGGAAVKVVVDGAERVRGIQLYRFTHRTNPIYQFSLKT